MRKLLFICLFIIGTSAVSFAQGGYQRTPEERAAQLKTSLTLNDDQTTKITAIYAAQAKKADSLRTASAGDMGSMMQKIMPIITATNDKIKAVLTPEQIVIFQKQVDAQAARMKQMMGGN